MAEFPSLPLWTDAYIADTAHLTNEEHGVYLRLIMFAWRSPNCCLPADDKRLAIMVGVTPKKWKAIKGSVLEFWTLNDGHYFQKRLTAERGRVLGNREKKVAAGVASGAARALKYKQSHSTSAATYGSTNAQHIGSKPSPSPELKKEVDKSTSKKIGARLHENWQPSSDNIDYAKQKGNDDANIIDLTEGFRDHWIAKSGKDACKLDWNGAWRTWVKNDIKFHGAPNDGGKRKPARDLSAHESLHAGAAAAASILNQQNNGA